MTAAAVVAILAFGAGVIEGVARGAGLASVPAGAIAGFVWGTIALGVPGLAWLLRWLMPPGWRGGAWPRAAALAAGVFVVAEFVVGQELALRFRDPMLVAVVAAGIGVVLAGLCVAVVVPLAARGISVVERRAPVGRVRRGLRVAGLAVGLGGAAALGVFARGSRPVWPRSDVVIRAIDLAEQITDVDGDGDGLVLPPRDCAPLSPRIDGRGCAERPRTR